MRRPLLIGFGSAVVVAAFAVGGVAVASATTPVPKPVTVTITSTACPGKAEFCFKPATLTIKPNTKIIWKNASDAPHTVTRCAVKTCPLNGGTGKDPNFHSPTINPGKTFTVTFHKTGTYHYFCQVHGYSIMHGTITVH